MDIVCKVVAIILAVLCLALGVYLLITLLGYSSAVWTYVIEIWASGFLSFVLFFSIGSILTRVKKLAVAQRDLAERLARFAAQPLPAAQFAPQPIPQPAPQYKPQSAPQFTAPPAPQPAPQFTAQPAEPPAPKPIPEAQLTFEPAEILSAPPPAPQEESAPAAPASPKPFCKKCGAPMKPEYAFCGSCGASR